MNQTAKLFLIFIVFFVSGYSVYSQNRYLVPVSVPTGYEQINSNRGIRAIWGAPAYTETRAVVKFTSTISNGESLSFDIGNTGNVYFIGLSSSTNETNLYSEPAGNSLMKFGMVVGLSNTARAYEGGTYTGAATTISTGNTLRITYSGSTILYQKSTNGTTFTTFLTSPNVPSGSYTIYLESPPQGAGPDNIYLTGTAIVPALAYVYKLKADSVKITNDNCNAELIIENSTKEVQGFLYNYGNGRTQFRKVSQKINDSVYIIGNDTLRLTSGSGGSNWGLSGNSGTNAANNFIGTIDNQRLVFRTKNVERATIDTLGNIGIGVSNPLYKLHVNGDAAFGPISINTILSRPGDRIRFGKAINPNDGQNILIATSSDSGQTHKNILVERDGNIGLGTGNGLQGWNVGIPALRITSDGRVGIGSTSFRLGNFGGPLNSSHLEMSVSNANEFTEGASYPNGQNYYYLGSILETPTGSNKRAPLRIAAKDLEFFTGGITDIEAARISENGNLLLGTTTDANYKLQVKGTAKIDTMPFLASRDTVLTYDPITKQIKVTKVTGGTPTSSSVALPTTITTTGTALTNATGLSFPVTAGIYYKFKMVLVFRTAATTTGIRLSISTPAFTVFSAKAEIPSAADGTNAMYTGWITSSGDFVMSPGVQALNTDYIAIVEGIISPSANGTVQMTYGSEIAGSMVTLKQGSIITIEPFSGN